MDRSILVHNNNVHKGQQPSHGNGPRASDAHRVEHKVVIIPKWAGKHGSNHCGISFLQNALFFFQNCLFLRNSFDRKVWCDFIISIRNCLHCFHKFTLHW
eukprot:TRINITY_DN67480_c6_g10_i1.p3 TRINITY_DN67480_c6_g10~~TRINITY_DN67480_c6_g10_i1.p3  ORF type:complete len:100 (+),score=2.65 TRINITY_DN67480_c6_g10_i1:220-519(+)